jgi:hypothetical protein
MLSKQWCLTQDSLVLTHGTVVSLEARADTRTIIAKTASGAITSRLVTLTLEHISTRWALNQTAVRATTTEIAHASNMLLGIPRCIISSRSLIGELLLCEANSSKRARVGAHGALTSNTFIVLKTSALTSFSGTSTLVRAFNYGMGIICRHNTSNPGLRSVNNYEKEVVRKEKKS